MQRHKGGSGESGTALLAVLFSVVVVGTLLHRLTKYAAHYTQLASLHEQGRAARELTRNMITAPVSGKRTCLELGIDDGTGPRRTTVTCTLGAPPFRFAPMIQGLAGRPDYTSLFAAMMPCPTKPQPETQRSFTSPVSPERCVISKLYSSLIVSHNIETDSVELQGHVDPVRIASPGEIVVNNFLTTDTDLLIVAGGTIRITSINSSSAKLTRVTLLSAHGDIEVRAVAPTVSVVALGRRLIAVPPSAITTGHPLPPVTAAGVSGIVM